MKFTFIFIALLFFFPAGVSAQESERVFIRNVRELAAIRANMLGEYELAADIVLPKNWTPIGSERDAFRGSFDGAGFTVRGGRGLFGVTDGAEIRNVTIDGAVAKPCKDGVAGGLVAHARSTKIANVCVIGFRVAHAAPVRAVGGIAGILENCTVENARVIDAEIHANGVAGGVVGILNRSRIAHSHSHAHVSATYAGGFVGEITNSSRIEFSSASGTVCGDAVAGGFAGTIAALGAPNTITNSLALSDFVSGENARRFAAATYHDGVNNCFAALGTVIISNERLMNVVANPFGNDGGDVSLWQIEKKVLT
jgi:hypothetical protein